MPGGGESSDDVGGSAFNRHLLRQLLRLPDSEPTSLPPTPLADHPAARSPAFQFLLHTLLPPPPPLEPEEPPAPAPAPAPPPSSKVKTRSTTVRIPIPRNLPPGPWEPLETSTPPPPPPPEPEEPPPPLTPPSSKAKARSTTVRIPIPRSLPPGPWEPREASPPPPPLHPPIADCRKPLQYREDPGYRNAALGSASQNYRRQQHLNGFFPNQMHYYRHPYRMNPRYSTNAEISANGRAGYSNCESAANPVIDRWPRDQRDGHCAPNEYNRVPSAHAARYQYKMKHTNLGGFRDAMCWKPKNTEQGRSHGSAEKKMSKLEWVPVNKRQAEKLNLEERDESQQGVEHDDELQTVSFNDFDQIECAAVCKLHIEELAVESPDDFEGGSPSEVEPKKQELGEHSSEGNARQEDGSSDKQTDSMTLHGYPSQREVKIYPQASLVKCTGSNSLREQHRSSQSMTSGRIECCRDIETLTCCFLSIYESLLPTADKKDKQNQLLQSLAKPINKEWSSAKLHLYGSCANSFGFPDSDVDICLAIDDPSMSKHDMLLKLADILQSEKYQDVEAITNTRVPIVKMTDLQSGISCDICINNLLAVANTKLLRDYSTIDNRMHQLSFIVKHWARSREVNKTYQDTLSSYAHVIMCIHFLQQRRPAILPCLQEMEITYRLTVEDIESAYFDQVDKLVNFGAQNKESIAKLVWEFFQYWAYYHNHTSDVVSILTGAIISKQMKNWTKRVGLKRHLFCIEDPFETSHDIGCVVDMCSLKILRDEFERAARILQHDPYPWVTLFQHDEPRFDAKMN